MQPEAALEVEVTVPCTEGQRHPIRLRIVSWEQWEVTYNPCEALLGRAFGLMAPCSHSVRENRDRLKQDVVQQLAHLGIPAVPALIQAFGDSDWDVRRAAAEALVKIGDAAAVPALRVHAEQLDAARESLQRLRQADYPLEQAVQELAQQGLWGVLMCALPAEQVRTAVAQLGAPAVPALIKALGDSYTDEWGNYPVRSAAAEALGKIGDAQAVPALIQAVGDWYEDVRRAAAWALGQIGDAQAVPALIKALGDSEWKVRRAAAWALGQIGDPRAVPALRVHAEYLEEARQALLQLDEGDYPLMQAVQELAQQELWSVLMRALPTMPVRSAIIQLGAQAVPALIPALDDYSWDVCSAAAEALGEIGGAQAVAALVQVLNLSYEYEVFGGDHIVYCPVREAVANALGKTGDAQAVPALVSALRAESENVRRAAATALGRIGDAQAVPALIQTLGDSDECVRSAAAKALGQIGDKQAVPALIKVLEDRKKNVRCAAAKALGQIGDAQAIPALEKLLSDNSRKGKAGRCPVRDAAQHAIEQIRAKQRSSRKRV